MIKMELQLKLRTHFHNERSFYFAENVQMFTSVYFGKLFLHVFTTNYSIKVKLIIFSLNSKLSTS